ncbi:aldose 1-epimerase [Paenibacillus selenitireducens]|uniref:Aldose 1-epimerase n=1 Tax=Paenibacillus selenitireducens TaxID=1324314 RepID=A0A1T2XJE1_9BACL|nr:aldose 1-epimerase [Paenibacillus selenitireducens]OPA79997.1 aldose 1-epimerase [Paenibacillus selenitireducens]
MYQVTKGQWNGQATYILHSDQLEVTLLPGLGNNVIRIWDKVLNRDVLRKPEESDFDFYMQKPYHFGIPLLIPPGRIRRGKFEYAGVQYQFDQNTANNNHIHGLHRTQSWKVTDLQEQDDYCSITTTFYTKDDPNWVRQYPTPLKLEMVLELRGAELKQTLHTQNLGEQAAPFGFGVHTWFMIDGEPDKWTVQVPVDAIYELDDELITTGEVVGLEPFEGLPNGMNLKGTNFDTVFRVTKGQPVEARLTREDGLKLIYSANQPYFKHWVLYTKGKADQFVCLEPYTWLTDAPNSKFGSDVTGLIDIQPQEQVELVIHLNIEHP